MSATRSAIDVMTAEDNALLASMRNETEVPEAEPADIADTADIEDASVEEAPEAVEEVEAAAAEPQPRKKTTADRIRELTTERKAAEARAIAAEQARAVAEGVVAERMRLLTEAAQAALTPQPVAPPPPPVIEVPDIDKDPVGHFKAKFELAERQAAERDAILRGFQEQQQQTQAQQALHEWGRASEAEFSSKEPSYVEATQFMLDRRKAQLSALGITDPAAQQQVIRQDIMQIALKSRADNANFGERMYRVAEAFGYQKKEAAPVVPVIPPIEAGLSAADRAAQAERGRANSTTIAAVGASTPIGLTPDRIANMSQAAFDKYYESIKNDPTKLRDLMGH